jgi:uncharacterized protein YndB with AHSA1/START domain
MTKMQFTVDKEKLETRMERVFDAPREKIWDAHKDPKKIERWWGPRKYETVIETLDFRTGGKWKFINKAAGEEYVFYGEFLEIKEPEKITWTFTYAPYPDSVVTETLTFTELPDGRTKMNDISSYPSLQALEGMMDGDGMQEGASETWDRLAELVEKE